MRSLSTCEKEMDLINHARRGGLKTYLSMHEGWGWGFNLLPKFSLWLIFFGYQTLLSRHFLSVQGDKKSIFLLFLCIMADDGSTPPLIVEMYLVLEVMVDKEYQ